MRDEVWVKAGHPKIIVLIHQSAANSPNLCVIVVSILPLSDFHSSATLISHWSASNNLIQSMNVATRVSAWTGDFQSIIFEAR